MALQDSKQAFKRHQLSSDLIKEVLKVKLAHRRTTDAATEAEFAKGRVWFATSEAIDAAEKAEAAVEDAAENVEDVRVNVLYVVKEAVIIAQAAAVRERTSCFETQLAKGRATLCEYEASAALLE